jgi:hypothetical protein
MLRISFHLGLYHLQNFDEWKISIKVNGAKGSQPSENRVISTTVGGEISVDAFSLFHLRPFGKLRVTRNQGQECPNIVVISLSCHFDPDFFIGREILPEKAIFSTDSHELSRMVYLLYVSIKRNSLNKGK